MSKFPFIGILAVTIILSSPIQAAPQPELDPDRIFRTMNDMLDSAVDTLQEDKQDLKMKAKDFGKAMNASAEARSQMESFMGRHSNQSKWTPEEAEMHDSLQGNLHTLQAKSESLRVDVDEAKATIKHDKAEVAKLQDKLDTFQVSRDDMAKAKGSSFAKNTNYIDPGERAALENELSDAKKELHIKSLEVAKLRDENKAKGFKGDDLASMLDSAISDEDGARADVKQLRKRLDRLDDSTTKVTLSAKASNGRDAQVKDLCEKTPELEELKKKYRMCKIAGYESGKLDESNGGTGPVVPHAIKYKCGDSTGKSHKITCSAGFTSYGEIDEIKIIVDAKVLKRGIPNPRIDEEDKDCIDCTAPAPPAI